MDTEEKAQLWGTITALNHLVEHLWAFILVNSPDPVAATKTMRDTVLREFDMPVRPEDVGDWPQLVSHHALSDLEDFWARVEDRASPERKA